MAAEAAAERPPGEEGEPILPVKQPTGWRQRRVDMPHIQGLRFLAMAWIISYHYIEHSPGSLLETFVNHRPLDLFTVISGFATHLAYGRRVNLGGPVPFMARRAAKIVFMYYLTLNLVTLSCIIHLSMDSEARLHDWMMQGATWVLSMLGLNVWVFPFAFFLTPQHWQPWPHNGPLWYVQGLIFCWLTYPVLRDYMCGPWWTRWRTVALMVGLGIGGVVPVMLLIWAIQHPMLWLIVKVFPVFMLPAFYLGAAACDLYLQELQATEEEAAGETAPSKWTLWKREWAGLLGELKLLLWICIQFEPYQSSEVHTWSLLFGSVLYLFAVAASCSSPQAYALGIRCFLGNQWVVFIGDASLCAFTFQEPVAIAYYWATRPGAFGGHMGQHWLPPWEFAIYLVLLYSISIPFGLYVNTPVSNWVLDKLTAAFPAVPRPGA